MSKSLKDEFDELDLYSSGNFIDENGTPIIIIPKEKLSPSVEKLALYSKEVPLIIDGLEFSEYEPVSNKTPLDAPVIYGTRIRHPLAATIELNTPIVTSNPWTSGIVEEVTSNALDRVLTIENLFALEAIKLELDKQRREELLAMIGSSSKVKVEDIIRNRRKQELDKKINTLSESKKAYGGLIKGLSSIEKLAIDTLKYIGKLPSVRYADGGPTKWGDMSITDKAPWIRFLVSKGITSSKGMEDAYNKYVDGGDKLVLNWPALLSVPHHVVANPDWDDVIETFAPNELQRMWPDIDVTEGYYAKNPYPGENTIMYNPNDKTVDLNTIALDGLHFMRDNETYRSFYNDLLLELPKDHKLMVETLNDLTWDPELSEKLAISIESKLKNGQDLTSDEKEYFYPAVDGYLRRLFAPDYMISKTPGDHGYAPKYVENLDILDKTNAIKELMESYILPEVTVTSDRLANKLYGPIVNYANDIMLRYHAEGGPLLDHISSRTSNLFAYAGNLQANDPLYENQEVLNVDSIDLNQYGVGNKAQYDHVTEIYLALIDSGLSPEVALEITNLKVAEKGWTGYSTGDNRKYNNVLDFVSHIADWHGRMYPESLKAKDFNSYYKGIMGDLLKSKYNSRGDAYKQELLRTRPGVKKRINAYRAKFGLPPLALNTAGTQDQEITNYASNGDMAYKDGLEYDLTQSLINELLRQGYQIEYV